MSVHPSLPHHVGRPRGERRVLDLGRLLIGLIVAALGVLYLLDTAGVLNAGRAVDHWWPMIFVAAGVLTLVERPPATARGLLFIAIGAVLLFFTTGLVHENGWDYVWPAALILAGGAIIARWSGRTIPAGAHEEDVVRATGVFGGPKVACTSQQFHGAWLTAIFGGVTLDLRQAGLAPGGASINATVAFGGIDVLVPDGWRVSVRSTPIFGGVDDKTADEPVPDDAPVLYVDAVALFGGVDIKHRR